MGPLFAPSTDFSHLPYYDSANKRIVNNDSPFISKNVLAQPFQDDLKPLGRGNHLHFIVPDPFAHTNADGKNLPVPNRWLVTKGDQCWVIESDFLSQTPIAGQGQVTTIIPIDAN